MPAWNGKWDGGRTYLTTGGTTRFVLERRHGPDRISIPLEVASLSAAQAELALYLRDPSAYIDTWRAARAATKAAATRPATLSAETVALFLADLRAKGRTGPYLVDLSRYLTHWGDHLGTDRDLSRVTARELGRALTSLPSPRKCIIAIKSYTSWLVSTFRLEAGANPAQALRVPGGRRSQRPKGYSQEVIEETYRHIHTLAATTHPVEPGTAQAVRDVFTLAALHGLHYSEISRIASDAETVIRPIPNNINEIAGTVVLVHKTGDRHVQSLTAQSLGAALRLRAAGRVPGHTAIRQYLERASRASGHPRIRLQELRHSFVGLAKVAGRLIAPSAEGTGLALDVIGRALGHKSKSTTERYYDFADVAPLVLLPLQLKHSDDPVPAPETPAGRPDTARPMTG